MNTRIGHWALWAGALALAGCAGHGGHGGPGGHGGHGPMGMEGKGMMAMATLAPTQGQTAQGMVMFHEKDGHLMVHAKVSGLKPGGEHGFHLHEKGDCSSPDGTSAGGHFNPDGQPHGPQGAAHHAGDMPSLKADANGVADQRFMLMGPTLAAGPAQIIGRGIIVHLNPDDYATQPTGNSGARKRPW